MTDFIVGIIPGSGPPHHNVPEVGVLPLTILVVIVFVGYLLYSGYKRRSKNS